MEEISTSVVEETEEKEVKMRGKRKKSKLYKPKKSNKLSPVQKLIKEAETFIDSFEYESAEQLLIKVLQREPNNVEAVDMLAGVFMETREFDKANDILLKVIELCPDNKYRSYFTLAQISAGEEAIDYYKRGIMILERLLANEDQSKEEKDKNSLRRDLSEAYCSVAEIYMTDLCDEENAEEQCRAHIDKSLECGPTFPEGHQCLANFLLILQKKDEAKEALTRSLSFWLPQYLAGDSEELLLNYDFKLEACKLLIELEMYDEASEILDALINERDTIVETWYLHGWLNFSRGEQYWDNARYYFKRVLKLKETGVPYDPEQINQVESCLAEIGPGDDDDDDDEDNENQENVVIDDNVDIDSDSWEDMED